MTPHAATGEVLLPVGPDGKNCVVVAMVGTVLTSSFSGTEITDGHQGRFGPQQQGNEDQGQKLSHQGRARNRIGAWM